MEADITFNAFVCLMDFNIRVLLHIYSLYVGLCETLGKHRRHLASTDSLSAPLLLFDDATLFRLVMGNLERQNELEPARAEQLS